MSTMKTIAFLAVVCLVAATTSAFSRPWADTPNWKGNHIDSQTLPDENLKQFEYEYDLNDIVDGTPLYSVSPYRSESRRSTSMKASNCDLAKKIQKIMVELMQKVVNSFCTKA